MQFLTLHENTPEVADGRAVPLKLDFEYPG